MSNDVSEPTLLQRAMSAVADLLDSAPEKGVAAWARMESVLGSRERLAHDIRRDNAKLALSTRALDLAEAKFEWEKDRKAAPAPAAPEKPARKVRAVVR